MSVLPVTIELVQGDVLDFRSDVLALKYAQHYYGSDEAVSSRLIQRGIVFADKLKPAPGSYCWVDSQGVLSSTSVLFVGVPPLLQFSYTEIEQFARRALSVTFRERPDAEHLAVTLHGPGFGLDEVESLHAEVRGILGAFDAHEVSVKLSRVSIVERSAERIKRLRAALDQLMLVRDNVAVPPSAPKPLGIQAPAPSGSPPPPAPAPGPYGSNQPLRPPSPLAADPANPADRTDLQVPGFRVEMLPNLQSTAQVEMKPRAFVAMPFAPEMEDVFYYGIQNPVRQLGYICERVDQEAFTGDILDQVRQRIESANIVIADLTGANPNVYLEVGYAWGRARPTVLVIKKADELRFDVRGQRCLQYQSIKDLETRLTNELKNLPANKKP